MKIKINKLAQYDDEISMEPGIYDYNPTGTNGWPMIRYKNEWYDLADVNAWLNDNTAEIIK